MQIKSDSKDSFGKSSKNHLPNFEQIEKVSNLCPYSGFGVVLVVVVACHRSYNFTSYI